MNIYQHLDELKNSDGVGNDALGLHRVFTSLGWNSNFITRIPRKDQTIPPANFLQPYQKFPFYCSDVHILHYGGQGYPYKYFQEIPGKKFLRFHNITPAHFYETTTTPEIYSAMYRFESLSYLELASLSIFCDQTWCDSPFNAYTLKSFDFKSVHVLPICKTYQVKDTSEVGNQNFNLCFVGRFAPQKKWEDLISFFSKWIQVYPHSELNCIGSVIGAFDGYFAKLQSLVSELSLARSVKFLTGESDEAVLNRLAKSTAFLSMSEHEGFCLPLLEAFGMGIPVFAYDAGAVRSTLRGGGFLFSEKYFDDLLENMNRILLNPSEKNKMIKKQKECLDYYNLFQWENQLKYLVNLA